MHWNVVKTLALTALNIANYFFVDRVQVIMLFVTMIAETFSRWAYGLAIPTVHIPVNRVDPGFGARHLLLF